jgi:acetyl-CoA synthetase
MHGITNLVVEAEFDARLWYDILENQKVTIWYTAPTAIRRLMRMEIDVMKEYDLSRLRLIHSVGEPLNPEAVRWSQQTLGMPILDNWWQTETGGIMIANYPCMPVKPGSMGKPLPGVKAEIVKRSELIDKLQVVEAPGEQGELALRPGWPSMFRGYLDDEERYQKCFIDNWYLTGDLASRDQDGYFWFVGRADDIIKTAGHMVGPFEVENVLMEHPAVAEAAVIGKPDPVMGETVKAFITLKTNFDTDEELNLEIKGFARERLGPAVAPKEIEFISELPKTRSGKIMRRLLRDQELEKANKST